MKKRTVYLLIFLFIAGLAFSLSSCNREGCPAQKTLHTKTDKKGNFKAKKSKSGLFPKGM